MRGIRVLLLLITKCLIRTWERVPSSRSSCRVCFCVLPRVSIPPWSRPIWKRPFPGSTTWWTSDSSQSFATVSAETPTSTSWNLHTYRQTKQTAYERCCTDTSRTKTAKRSITMEISGKVYKYIYIYIDCDSQISSKNTLQRLLSFTNCPNSSYKGQLDWYRSY